MFSTKIILVITRSTDGGASFESPRNLSQLPAFIGELDLAASGKKNVYVVWSQGSTRLARSTDGGASFDPTKTLSDNGNAQSDNPKIAVQGNTLYVVWLSTVDTSSSIILAKSTNGGVNFAPLKDLSGDIESSENLEIAISGKNAYVVWSGGPIDVPMLDTFFIKCM